MLPINIFKGGQKLSGAKAAAFEADKFENIGEFSRIVFNMPESGDDAECITIVVNGIQVVAKRGVEVVLPNEYIECVDQAKVFQYAKGGEVSERLMYPYRYIGRSSKEEYLRQLQRNA
jgi:hypothetical protein